MRQMKTPITGQLYHKLKKLKYTDLYEEVKKILPPQYSQGYGLYDVQLMGGNGSPYITYQIGDTCD